MKTIKLNEDDARNVILVMHHALIDRSDKLKEAEKNEKSGKDCPLYVGWVEYLRMLRWNKEFCRRVMIDLQKQTGIEEVPENMINTF